MNFESRSTGTVVYGGCVEPGGMELEMCSWEEVCPDCGKTAVFSMRETAHGGCINLESSAFCQHCGFSEDDGFE